MKFWIILFINVIYQIKFCGTSNCDPNQCVKNPTFISNWTRMVAQDNLLSEITVQHNLNDLPVKVDVQVKQITGNDTDFIFNGMGSAQRDDDYDSIYAGIVYMYDNDTVRLIAPNSNDGSKKGTIIFTGDGIWKGSSDQNDKEAYVRVRVWHQCDFSAPDFESNWLSVTSNKANSSFLEILHGLGTTPEYVSVQVKLGNTNYIADGIGCSMTHKDTNGSTSWGGVIYGYDLTRIRIWLPGSKSGSLFSASDGWGNGGSYNWKSGYIKVKAWIQLKTMHTKDREFGVVTNTQNEHLQTPITALNSGNPIDVDNDIFEMLVKPKNGSNENFYFKGSGIAQTAELSGEFGGLVYAYSDSYLRMYHPPFARYQYPHNGYLLYIDSLWGNGRYQQKTNDVKLVSHAWRPYDSCPIPTTTTTTSTTSQTTTTTTIPPPTSETTTTTTPTTTTTTSTTTTTTPTTTTTTPTTTTKTTTTTTTTPTTTTTTPTTTTTTTPTTTTTTPTTTPTTTTTTPTTTTTTPTTTTIVTTTTTSPTTTASPTTTTTIPTTTSTTPVPTTFSTTSPTTMTTKRKTTTIPTKATIPTITLTKTMSRTTPKSSLQVTTIAPKIGVRSTVTHYRNTTSTTSFYNLNSALQAETGGGLSSNAKVLLGVAGSLLLLAGLLCLLVALVKRKKRKRKAKRNVVRDIRHRKAYQEPNYDTKPVIDEMAFI